MKMAAALGRLQLALACLSVVLLQHTGLAAQESSITLRFVNNFTEPYFDFSIELIPNTAKTILTLMEEAAWQDTTFKWSVEYHASVPGYMVNAVRKDKIENGNYVRNPFVFGDVNWDGNQSYWRIQIDGYSIPVGISIYQPKKGQVVTFELVT